jgi:hypothetical protein
MQCCGSETIFFGSAPGDRGETEGYQKEPKNWAEANKGVNTCGSIVGCSAVKPRGEGSRWTRGPVHLLVS